MVGTGTVPGCDVCLGICATDTLSSLCEGPAAQTACPHHRHRAAVAVVAVAAAAVAAAAAAVAVSVAAVAVAATAVAAVAVVLSSCQQLLPPHAGQIASWNGCSFAAL